MCMDPKITFSFKTKQQEVKLLFLIAEILNALCIFYQMGHTNTYGNRDR